jgi:peroxiredoxin
VEVGQHVPHYSASDLAGQEVSLEDHLGEVVLLNVWATWCGPCRIEMPPIQASYDRFKDRGFTVLAVSIDAGPGYRAKVTRFVEEFEINFPVLLDPESRISRTLQTIGVPETFVLDRQGRIVKRLIGATDWDSQANQALIEELLRM